jgi:hypothetical protein
VVRIVVIGRHRLVGKEERGEKEKKKKDKEKLRKYDEG